MKKSTKKPVYVYRVCGINGCPDIDYTYMMKADAERQCDFMNRHPKTPASRYAVKRFIRHGGGES